ncbi:MAG: FAD-binding oxidoreductase [Anaerolineaceae bacterium]|nr:FAD-binding oxidoreductase [Anaerolineaceae bacterium]
MVDAHRVLARAAAITAPTWGLFEHLFPESVQTDENRSVWIEGTPFYEPLPPLRGETSADLVIIGGGFTGTSTAYHFSRRYPEKRVILLEARTIGNGASGRNGGHLLNGLADPRSHATPEMTRRVHETTARGIQNLIALIQRHNLAVDHQLGGALRVFTDAERAEKAHQYSEEIAPLGIAETFLTPAELQHKLNLQGVHGAILDPLAGQINGAQLTRSLRPILLEAGVEIYENTPVIQVEEGRSIQLHTPAATVKAQAIVLATNGYTTQLGYFRDAIFALHSHVFATAPQSAAELAALGWREHDAYSDDLDRISYVARTSDRRIVFGGGSNASYAYRFNNQSVYPGSPERAKPAFAAMKRTFQQYLPGSASLPITHRWTGTLGYTLARNTLMGVRGAHRNVFYALGYCGHGVNLANIAGEVLTDLYSGDDERWRGLPFYDSQYLRIPPEPFRWLGYQLFTRLTGKAPRTQ